MAHSIGYDIIIEYKLLYESFLRKLKKKSKYDEENTRVKNVFYFNYLFSKIVITMSYIIFSTMILFSITWDAR